MVIELEQLNVNLSQLLAQMPKGCGLDLVDYGPNVGRELPQCEEVLEANFWKPNLAAVQ